MSLAELYRTDTTNGWSAGMRAITRTLLADQPFPDGSIVEIGCGGGAFLRTLAKSYPAHTCIGADLHPGALQVARRNAPAAQLLQADVSDLPLAADSAACVLALDVLDQTGVFAPRALAEIRRVLHPQGLLIVRVSAYPWLHGPHDRAYNTRQRYRADQLRSLLFQTGFQPVRATYANTLLGLLAIPPRLLQRAGLLHLNERATTSRPGLRAVVAATLGLESRLLRRANLTAGLSLYMLARKRESASRLPHHAQNRPSP